MTTTNAYLKQIKGITFAGKTNSNHWITVDGPEEFGGSNAGVRPKELVLIALAGCTSSDVVSILKKKRVILDDFEVNISAEMSEEHPKVYTNINLEFVFYGEDINEKDVERAIELSQTKYCSVSAMLNKSVEINHTYKVVKPELVEI
jgi:putative redox protein